jgi:hypothetical protein
MFLGVSCSLPRVCLVLPLLKRGKETHDYRGEMRVPNIRAVDASHRENVWQERGSLFPSEEHRRGVEYGIVPFPLPLILLSPLDVSRGFMFPSWGMPRSTSTLPHQGVRMFPTPSPSGVSRPRNIQRREEYEVEREWGQSLQEGRTLRVQ